MSTEFTDKTTKATYKNFRIHIYDVKLHKGQWYCTITISSPAEASAVCETRLNPIFDCSSDDEAIEIAKQYAVTWIEDNAL